jgi:hypothetical protein
MLLLETPELVLEQCQEESRYNMVAKGLNEAGGSYCELHYTEALPGTCSWRCGVVVDVESMRILPHYLRSGNPGRRVFHAAGAGNSASRWSSGGKVCEPRQDAIVVDVDRRGCSC